MDIDRRVIPGDAAFEFGCPEHAFVVGGKFHADMLAECQGAFADVHGHVKHCALHNAHELAYSDGDVGHLLVIGKWGVVRGLVAHIRHTNRGFDFLITQDSC